MPGETSGFLVAACLLHAEVDGIWLDGDLQPVTWAIQDSQFLIVGTGDPGGSRRTPCPYSHSSITCGVRTGVVVALFVSPPAPPLADTF